MATSTVVNEEFVNSEEVVNSTADTITRWIKESNASDCNRLLELLSKVGRDTSKLVIFETI